MDRTRPGGAAYWLVAICLMTGSATAQQYPGARYGGGGVAPYPGMYGSMGNVYGPGYGQRQTGSGLGDPTAPGGAPGFVGRYPAVPGLPQSGMYGSMGNVYSPYYRQLPMPTLSDMAGPQLPPGMQRMGIPSYQLMGPYSSMYGSMGNLYHPYYRRFHMPGMAGMSGAVPAPAGGR